MDKLNSNSLLSHISMEFKKKQQDKVNWGNHLRFLQNLVGKKEDQYLGTIVEVFIILTDIIDDIMDDDNPNISQMLKMNRSELSETLFLAFTAIRVHIPKVQFGFFVDNVTNSLLVQYEEDQYKVSKDSNEKEYFYLINRSVYLMQSLVYLVDSSPSEVLLQATKLVAYNAQIENDINDLEKHRSFDLIDRKGTLPIIKTIEWANKNEDFLFLEKFAQLNRKSVNDEMYNFILHSIKDSGSLEYCKLLSLSFQSKAVEMLVKEFPNKETLIREFIISS